MLGFGLCLESPDHLSFFFTTGSVYANHQHKANGSESFQSHLTARRSSTNHKTAAAANRWRALYKY